MQGVGAQVAAMSMWHFSSTNAVDKGLIWIGPWGFQITIQRIKPALWLFPVDFNVQTNIGNWVLVSVNYMSIPSKTPFSRFFHDRCIPISIEDIHISDVIMACSPLVQHNVYVSIITRRRFLSFIVGEHSETWRATRGTILLYILYLRRSFMRQSLLLPLHPSCANG